MLRVKIENATKQKQGDSNAMVMYMQQLYNETKSGGENVRELQGWVGHTLRYGRSSSSSNRCELSEEEGGGICGTLNV